MRSKIINAPGGIADIEFTQGETIGQILEKYEIEIDFEKQALSLGGTRVCQDQLDHTELTASPIIIARGARGEAPTPLVKSAVKYLKNLGYIEGGGKGDHRKFTSDSGAIVILNPAKNDHKHLDLGSAKGLAKHFGVSLGNLYTKIG